MQGLRSVLIIVGLLSLGAATVAFAGGDDSPRDRGDRHGDRGDRHSLRDHWRGDHWRGRFAFARLENAEGERVGKVFFKERRGTVFVFARVHDLPPDFHGFHIHTTGRCDPPTFTSAGGHFNPTGDPHGAHAGDLPSLLVNEDGTGLLATATDRFSIADLRAGDGSAVMVHSGRDNFANIPNRYRSPASPPQGGPDPETLATGDAGSRLACGVVR